MSKAVFKYIGKYWHSTVKSKTANTVLGIKFANEFGILIARNFNVYVLGEHTFWQVNIKNKMQEKTQNIPQSFHIYS